MSKEKSAKDSIEVDAGGEWHQLADGEHPPQTTHQESAAIDFVHDAFGHLKAISTNQGGAALLKAANVPSDAGVIDISHTQDFIAAAKTRQWERGKSVRALA